MSEKQSIAAYERALNAVVYEALALGIDAAVLEERVRSGLLEASSRSGKVEDPDTVAPALQLVLDAISFAKKDGDIPQ